MSVMAIYRQPSHQANASPGIVLFIPPIWYLLRLTLRRGLFVWRLSGIEQQGHCRKLHCLPMKASPLTHNRYCPCLVLPVEYQPRKRVYC